MEELQQAPARESHREENAGENLAVQTTGSQAVDLEHNSTTFNESDELRRGGESKSEEENSKKKKSDNLSRDSES